MIFDWTAEVVGRMHTARITGLVLAEEAGISNAYLSHVLHKTRICTDDTRQRILDALERLEQRQSEAVNQEVG